MSEGCGEGSTEPPQVERGWVVLAQKLCPVCPEFPAWLS